MIRYRRRTPYEQAVAGMKAGTLRVQIEVVDRLTPTLRRLAYSLETMMYRADHKWHRSQMVGAR